MQFWHSTAIWAAGALAACTLLACTAAPAGSARAASSASQQPAAVSASTPKPGSQPQDMQSLRRTWMLVALPGFRTEDLTKSKAQMHWERLPQGAARMGCNQIGFDVQAKPDGTLVIGQLYSTLMACADMRLEAAFGKWLPTMQHYAITGHRLTLRNAAGQQMEFVAADWD